MSASTNSFPKIMAELGNMKEELLRLHFAYARNAPNIHHISQIKALTEDLKQTQSKLSHLQGQASAARLLDQSKKKMLEKQNEQLLNINEQLVKSNQKFKTLLQKEQQQREALQAQISDEKQMVKKLELKHQKEIENLKLMQAQELYILKKKQKKN